MPLRLFEYNAKEFEMGQLAFLGNASKVKITEEINAQREISFDYPIDDEKAELIIENRIVVCEEQAYRIYETIYSNDCHMAVKASHVYNSDGFRTHIQNIPDHMGKSPKTVLEYAVSVENCKFTVLTEKELNERGMTWVGSDGFLIDFFSLDKTNLFDAVKAIIENCGHGEIYADNYKIAIVKQIGKPEATVRLALSKNLQKLQIHRDITDMITRIYPYGAEDAHIGNKTYPNKPMGQQYIDSPNAKIYGIRAGYRDYSDYNDPDDIYDHAMWEFDELNKQRIDIPVITITGDLIDLSKLEECGDVFKVNLGDEVIVMDRGIEVPERIIRMERYPYEPNTSNVTVGRILNNMFMLFKQLEILNRKYKKVTNVNGGVVTKYFQGKVNSTQNPVRSENELLKIVGDLLTIYQKNGESKKKRLELGNVDGKFTLNIYDESGKQLKIKLGDHGDSYAFAIYDGNGKPAIYMDENGEVKFSGTVQTTKNAVLGTSLTLGGGADAVIKFMGPINAEGSIRVTDHEMDINADYVRIRGRDILAEIDEIKRMLNK